MRWLAMALLALVQVQGAALSGVVRRAGTDMPVARARVLVAPHASVADGVRMATTDERGRFSVSNLPDGVYRVWAEQEDYVRSVPVDATIESGAADRSLTIPMVPTGVIVGRVLDGTAEPLARVYVRAEGGAGVWEAQTNDLGEYRLFGLPPGAYVVSAAPYLPPRIEEGTYVRPTPPGPFSRGEGQFMIPLARLLQAGELIDPRALAGAGRIRVFYPGTADADSAVPLELRPGETMMGVDFVLP